MMAWSMGVTCRRLSTRCLHLDRAPAGLLSDADYAAVGDNCQRLIQRNRAGVVAGLDDQIITRQRRGLTGSNRFVGLRARAVLDAAERGIDEDGPGDVAHLRPPVALRGVVRVWER